MPQIPRIFQPASGVEAVEESISIAGAEARPPKNPYNPLAQDASPAIIEGAIPAVKTKEQVVIVTVNVARELERRRTIRASGGEALGRLKAFVEG